MAAVFYTAFQRNLVFKPIAPAPVKNSTTEKSTVDTADTAADTKLAELENRENNNVERICKRDNCEDKDTDKKDIINLNRTRRSGSCSDVVNRNRSRKSEKLCTRCQSRTQSVDGRASTQPFQNAVSNPVSRAVSHDDIDTNFACLGATKPPLHSNTGLSLQNLNLVKQQHHQQQQQQQQQHSMGQKPPRTPPGARGERFRGRRGRSRLSMHEEVMLRAARNRSRVEENAKSGSGFDATNNNNNETTFELRDVVERRDRGSTDTSPTQRRIERPLSYPARCRRYPGSLERYMAPNFDGYDEPETEPEGVREVKKG